MMRLLRRLRARIKYRHFERDLREELDTHRALTEDALEHGGLPKADARWRAARLVGNTTLAREDARQVWIARWFDELSQDVRYAIRGLRRAPGFAAVASLTLALGIGANAAIFSVVDAAMFRPVPYRDADRLVDVYRLARSREGGSVLTLLDGYQIRHVRDLTSVFEGAEAYGDAHPIALATGSDQSPWLGGFGPSLPAFLGVSPQIGRVFDTDDVAAGNVIVLSDAYWRRAFGGDQAVLGRSIAFADRTYTIVGVMPPTFRAIVGAQADGWTPMADSAANNVVARLRPGLAFDQATRELDAALTTRASDTNALRLKIDRVAWNRAPEATRVMLLCIAVAVALVLMIACANVANLLLARTLSRQREIAVRTAIGASRQRVVRQFIVEGMVLAVIGGAEAALAAWWSIRAIPQLMPAKLMHVLLAVTLPTPDARVLGVGCLAVLLAAAACAIAPAMRASGAATTHGMLARGDRMAGQSSQQRVRLAFQSIQIALTLVLVVGAVLLATSAWRLVSMPPGFVAGRLAYVSIDLPSRLFPQESRRFAVLATLRERLSAIPGVRSVAVGPPPTAGGTSTIPLAPDGRPDLAISLKVNHYSVSENYFAVTGMTVVDGRSFESADSPLADRQVVISEDLARRLWPNRSAVGERLQRGTEPDVYTVVGVTRRLRTIELAKDDVQLFLAATTSSARRGLVMRLSDDAGDISASVRDVVRSVDPAITVRRFGTPDGLFAELDPVAVPRFYATLLGVLATLGLVTATVGLFGLTAQAVSQRTREIGIRLALGAGPDSIRRLVIADAARPIIVGVGIGLVLALWMAKFLTSQLFHVAPHDPLSITAAVVLLLAASALAVVIPLRRALGVDPAVTLRAE